MNLKPGILTKSNYVLGLQCPRALWLKIHHPERIVIDPASARLFATGHRVGELSKRPYPDGIDLEHIRKKEEAVRETSRIIKEGALVIFEAAAMHDNIFSRADILVRKSKSEPFDIIEVKSSGEVKSVYQKDVAFQVNCFVQAGYEICHASLMHINKEYVRLGEINPYDIFHTEVLSLYTEMPEIQETIPRFLDVIESSDMPDCEAGRRCDNPYTCPFHGECNKPHPKYSIHELPRLSDKRRDEMLNQNIEMIEDIPYSEASELLTAKMIPYYEAVKYGTILNKKKIAEFLATLVHPLSFLDFETVNSTIPLFNDSRPFQQVPFQFSLRNDNGDQSHLSRDRKDPRRALAKAMIESMPSRGSIIVWNERFERSVLLELAELFPEYSSQLKMMSLRLWDLMRPFEQQWYVDKNFHGSYSIKKVLPALTGLSYDSLAIKNGEKALMLYEQWIMGELTEEQWAKVMSDLEMYCGMDTRAEVEILNHLQRLFQKPLEIEEPEEEEEHVLDEAG